MKLEELRDLVSQYKPNKETLAAMANIKVLATVGPSASGKTTVMEKTGELWDEFDKILVGTSRPPREREKNGEDYLFRTQEEIVEDAKKGRLVQIAVGPNGHLYSTKASNYPAGKIGLIALVPAAVKKFRDLPIGFFEVAFIVPHSYEQWQKWLSRQASSSGWTDEQFTGRLKEALDSYQFALPDKKINFVLNDNPEKAAHRLAQVAHGETPESEALAQDTAKLNYKLLAQKLRTIR